MLHKGTWLTATALLSGMYAGNLGCVVTEAGLRRPLHEASLGNGRTVRLKQHCVMNSVLFGPDYNFAELSLAVDSGKDAPGSENVVARRGSSAWWNLSLFEFGELEARADEDRRRVWVVDIAANRVVASLDCASGATTGPEDEAPEWATLKGGVLLEGTEPKAD